MGAWLPWAIVGALALAVLLVVTLGGGKGAAPQATAGEIFLEPAAQVGPEPFTETVTPPPVPVTVAASSTTTPATPAPAPTTATTAGGPVTIRAESGATAGLYGGTLDNGRCDREQMIAFLQADPAKGDAWVAALNADSTLRWSGGRTLTRAQIPEYIRSLTPVILRTDTRVTNNGFLNGRPTPRQAVLQAGTAVLVDQYGVPRARCACGNPLLPPRAIPSSPTYTGIPWAGFTPSNVTVIQQSTTIINNFTLINISTGEKFGRPRGTEGGNDGPAPSSGPTTTRPVAPTSTLAVPPDVVLGSGDVQVTLLWQGPVDLDLHVTDPSGSEISFISPRSASGGELDVDQNGGCIGGDSTATHVENVFWPSGGAPAGQYQAVVVVYSTCGGTTAGYELRVQSAGRIVYDQRGTLAVQDGASSRPVTFTR